jgi:hypothetical protein
MQFLTEPIARSTPRCALEFWSLVSIGPVWLTFGWLAAAACVLGVLQIKAEQAARRVKKKQEVGAQPRLPDILPSPKRAARAFE